MDSGNYSKPKDRLVIHNALKPVLRNGRDSLSGGELQPNIDVYEVRPGDRLELETHAQGEIRALLGKDGSLTIEFGDRTVVVEGYVAAEQQGGVHIAKLGGEELDVPAILKDTDPKVDLSVLAGPDHHGSGVYVPFADTGGLGSFDAVGLLDPTAFDDKGYDYENKEYLILDTVDADLVLLSGEEGPAPQFSVIEPGLNPVTPPQVITYVPPPSGGGGTVPPSGGGGGGSGGTGTLRYDLKIADNNDGRSLFDSTSLPTPFAAGATLNLSDLKTGGNAINIERSNSATATIFRGIWADGGGATHQAFILTIDKATGQASFTLTAPLDHSKHNLNGPVIDYGDRIRFDIIATYTDYLGNSSSGNPATIYVEDQGPAMVDISLAVNEDALAGGHVGGAGDNPRAGLNAAGDIQANYGSDGFVSFALSGLDSKGVPLNAPIYDLTGNVVQYEWKAGGGANGKGALIGFTVNGGGQRTNVFELDVLDPLKGTIDARLFTTLRHNDSTSEDNLVIKLQAELSDGDGDRSIGFVTLTINDDRPEAIADLREFGVNIDTQIAGNVVTGLLADGTASGDQADFFGADGAAANKIVAITGYHGAGTVNTDIIGKYGTLHLNADGTYSYNLGGAGTVAPSGGATDVFTYTIADQDGDRISSTLTISLDGRPVVVPPSPTGGTNNPGGPGSGGPGTGGPGTGPDALQIVDEDNIGQPSGTVTGRLVNFGIDRADPTNPFTVNYVTGQTITDSQTGARVDLVKIDATHWVGRATSGGNTFDVFRLTLDANTGNYTYTQLRGIVHGDPNNPNDIVPIRFEVTARDRDGDVSNTGVLEVDIQDSAPTANADARTIGLSSTGITGNVVDGNGAGDVKDSFGADGSGANKVVAITGFNGAGTVGSDLVGKYGILHLNADGTYTYSLGGAGSQAPVLGDNDQFTYTIQDSEGDKSQTTLTIHIATQPVVNPPTAPVVDEDNIGNAKANGNLVDFGTVGAATTNPFTVGLTAGQIIKDSQTNNDVVLVQTSATTWEGRAGAAGPVVFTLALDAATGKYSYELLRGIIHSDPAQTDESFLLKFDVKATDKNGDSDSAVFTVDIHDSVANANDDVREYGVFIDTQIKGNVVTGKLADGTASGDTADIFGADKGSLFGVTNSNNVAGTLNADFAGRFGVLHLNSDGSYTYRLNNGVTLNAGDAEVFTYTLKDKDGDLSATTLTINFDGRPVVVPPTPTGGPGSSGGPGTGGPGTGGPGTGPDAINAVDEDNIATGATATGRLVNFGLNGADATVPFTVGLTSTLTDSQTKNAVTLAQIDATHWEGRAAGAAGPVFTLALDRTTGNYTFTLLRGVIHPDATNANDRIAVKFDVTAKDADGDVSNKGTLQINIDDSGPTASNDGQTFVVGGTDTTGNVLTNDSFGADGKGTQSIISVKGAGTTSTSGNNFVVHGTFGDLTIDKNTGAYTYQQTGTPAAGASDTFTYTIEDADGDDATANLVFAANGQPTGVDVAANNVREALLTTRPEVTVTGAGPIVFGIDGPNTTGAPYSVAYKGTLFDISGNQVRLVAGTKPNEWVGRADNSNADVFTLTLDPATGNYTFTLLSAVKHDGALGQGSNLPLVFDVTGTDGNGDSATGKLTVTIIDDVPVGTDLAASTINESALGSGAVTVRGGGYLRYGADDTDEASQITKVELDKGIVVRDVASNEQVTIVAGATEGTWEGKTTSGLVVFTLLLDAAGNYEFTLNRAIAHDNPGGTHDSDLPLKINITGADRDNDNAVGSITITIHDDVPTANNDIRDLDVPATGVAVQLQGNVVTGLFANGTATGDIADDFGKDNAATNKVVGVRSSLGANGPIGGTGIHGEFGTLVINADGSYTYTLDVGVTLTDGDSETFFYTIADKDGDRDEATLRINFDGNPVIVPPAPGGGGLPPAPDALGVVDEDNIGQASGTASGRLVYFGLDGAFQGANPFTLAFNAAQGPVTDTLTGNLVTLSSAVQNGSKFVWTGQAAGVAGPVFTISLDTNDGKYYFTLNRSIEHPNSSDPNDSLSIQFDVTAKDGNGDISTPGTLRVDVLDSGPSFSGTTALLSISEATDLNVIKSGILGANFNKDGQNADVPIALHLSGATPLTASGHAINIQGDGTSALTGIDSVTGTNVFTLVWNSATNNYDFKLLAGLQGTTQINFNADARDGDGDLKNQSFAIKVNDSGIAAVPAFTSVTVDEKYGTYGTAADPSQITKNGSLNLTDTVFGTDGRAAGGTNGAEYNGVAINLSSNVVVPRLGLDPTRLDHSVNLIYTGNGHWLGYTDDEFNTGRSNQYDSGLDIKVFELIMNDQSGAFSFSLFEGIKHKQPAFGADRDHQNLDFTVKLVDADGSFASRTLSIDVIDDTPIANPDLVEFLYTTKSGDLGRVFSGDVIKGTGTTPDVIVPGTVTNIDTIGPDGSYGIGTIAQYNLATNTRDSAETTVDPSGTKIQGYYGTLFIKADGTFSYTLGRNIDGSESANFDFLYVDRGPADDAFQYSFKDRDGDIVYSTLHIFLNPDNTSPDPTVTTPAALRVYEAGLATGLHPSEASFPVQATGTFYVKTGNNAALTELKFTETNPKTGLVTNFTFANSAAISAAIAAGGVNGALVLSDTTTKLYLTGWNEATGAVNFRYELQSSLNHGATDSLQLPITVEVKDGFGKAATGTLAVDIVDDFIAGVADTNEIAVPATGALGNSTGGNVLQGDAKGGKADKVGADGVASDAISAITGFGTTNTSGNNYVVTGRFGTLTIDKDSGIYTYVLNSRPSSSGQTDVFTYTLKDGDGDTNQTTLTINLDGRPVIQNAAATVNETALSGGNGGGTTTTGALHMIDIGLDSWNSTGATVTLSADSQAYQSIADKARGTFIRLVSGGTDIWVGRDNNGTGATIFTLTLNRTTGDFTFTLNNPIYHATSTNPTIHFDVVGRDADGDQTNTGTLGVTITDDQPAPTAPSSVTVNETGLPNGLHDFGKPANASGSFAPNYGADGFSALNVITTNALTTTQLNRAVQITNGSQVFQVKTSFINGVLYGWADLNNNTSRESNENVFTITFTKDGSGRYTGAYDVQLLQSLWHDSAINSVENDQMIFAIGLSVTDGDGDTSNNLSFNVTVTDDAPRIAPDAISVNESDIGTAAANITGRRLNWNPGADLAPSGGAGLTIGDSNHGHAQVIVGTDLKTAGGYYIVTEWNAATHTLTGYADINNDGYFNKNSTGDFNAFTVTLEFDSVNNRYNGSYDINLLKAIDRNTLVGQNHLQIAVTALDQDGDKTINPIDVTIVDAVPQVFTPTATDYGDYSQGVRIGNSYSFVDSYWTGNILTGNSIDTDFTAASIGKDGIARIDFLLVGTQSIGRRGGTGSEIVSIGVAETGLDGHYVFRIEDTITGVRNNPTLVEGDDVWQYTYKYTITDNDGSTATGLINFVYDRVVRDLYNFYADTTNPPVVLDLNHDNHLSLIDPTHSGVAYDYGNDGTYNRTGWVGKEDGFLFIDLNNDRKVTESKEFVFTEWTDQATTDLAAISVVFDSNHDKMLDANDELFHQFAVWQDLNQDGVSQDNEVFTLKDLGIVALDLSAVGPGYDQDGNYVFGETKIIYTDGQTGLAGDVGLTLGEEVPAPQPETATPSDSTNATNTGLGMDHPFNSVDANGNLTYDPALAAAQIAHDQALVSSASATLLIAQSAVAAELPAVADSMTDTTDHSVSVNLATAPASDQPATDLLDTGTFWVGVDGQQVGLWGVNADGDPILLPLDESDKKDLYADLNDINGIWGVQHLAELALRDEQTQTGPSADHYIHVDVPGGTGDTLPDIVPTWGDEETAKDLGLGDQYRTAQADNFFMQSALVTESGAVKGILSAYDIGTADHAALPIDHGVAAVDHGVASSDHGASAVDYAALIDLGPAIPLPEPDPQIQQHQLEKQAGA